MLFIDYQNAYRRARSIFFPNSQSGRHGHLKPMDLGQLIANRGGPGGASYALSEVRVYSGRPDPNTCAPSPLIESRAKAGSCPEL